MAGQFLSPSKTQFNGSRQHAAVLKRSAPIGIIALGMTVIHDNGNIDLSVGAIFGLCPIVMLDSQTWRSLPAWVNWA